LLEAEDYTAAAAIGERWVELTEQEFGPESLEAGAAYVGWAEALTQAGEYEAAEENFLVAVEIFRNADGIYSENLVRPLVGLGDSYHLDGEYLNAVSAFNEARTVSRRVLGLLNKEQIAILDRMTRTFVSMGEYLEADQHQREALLIVERNHPPESIEVLSASKVRPSVKASADCARRSSCSRRLRSPTPTRSPRFCAILATGKLRSPRSTRLRRSIVVPGRCSASSQTPTRFAPIGTAASITFSARS
jgi:tetratricopeptide (TPR) repeat protein